MTRLFASVACAAKRQPYFGVEVTSVCGELPVSGDIGTVRAACSLRKRTYAFHSDRALGQGCPSVGDMKGAMATTGHSSCAPAPFDGVNRAEWNASSIDHVNRVSRLFDMGDLTAFAVSSNRSPRVRHVLPLWP